MSALRSPISLTATDLGRIVDSGASSTSHTNLHVLIPDSKSDPNLCKAIISAEVLGYPRPVIINWEHIYDDPDLFEGC
jgi:hypothetical protein